MSVCPNCKAHFSISVRICFVCKKVIGAHHKWFFNSRGRIQHRHCDYPEYYTHPKIKNAANNKKYSTKH